jgi:hypothetical protein
MMMTLQRLGAVVAGVLVLSCILACGALGKVQQAQQRVETSNDLKQIVLTWISYCDANTGKTPTSQQALIDWVQKTPGMSDPKLIALLQQTGPGGKYTVRWGDFRFPASFKDGTSNTPQVWESQVPTSGGLVAMADGSVRQMTAGEFATAPKPNPAK